MATFSNPQAYESWMGRWSTRLAPEFLRFANLNGPGRYLDVGSGTGILARCILDEADGSKVVGIEPSAEYVEYARSVIANPRARFDVGDASDISFEHGEFDAALALLVLQEIPKPEKAVGEMVRVTRPGGCVAATQWDFITGMPSLSLFWETVGEIIPEQQARVEAADRCGPGLSDAGTLANLWSEFGLNGVETAELEITMEFSSFTDYWEPFLSCATPTSSYASTLPLGLREDLASRLRDRILANQPDGPFSFPARAIAVRGQVP